MVTAAALLATITIGTTACSGQSGAAVAPSVSSTSRVRGSTPPVPSSRSSRAVKASYLARSSPVRLQIASIGVDSALMALGLRADGSMEVPPRGFPAGWYTGGPTPGELGPAIIAGHVDWTGPAVFYNLHNLKPDDLVTVIRKDGSVAVFRVTLVEEFPKNKFPTELVYGNIDFAGLRLITCGGVWNPKIGHYEDNIVAFAEFVAPAP